MKLKLKQLALAAATMVAFVTGALAQEYPGKPVKIIVGYVPGGGPDFVARSLGQKLTEILGQPFVVENRPGAGATTATAQVAKMPADGYTLLLGETGQLVIAPSIYKKLAYDPVKDFTPISLVGTSSGMLLVSNSKSSIKTIHDLLREAKANPGKVDYGSSGIGTIHHIAMEVFKTDAGLNVTHIPYKGSGQSITSVLAGEVPLLITSVPAAASHIQAGNLNLLAVSSPNRMAAYPDTPSLSEIVKDYDYLSEMGLLAPAGLPADVLAKLSKAIKQAAESQDLLDAFKKNHYILKYTTPAEYAENIQRNLKKYERAVRIAKVPVND
jgi:tripartite-type tricarboxylate transporter receptor subunit TctC